MRTSIGMVGLGLLLLVAAQASADGMVGETSNDRAYIVGQTIDNIRDNQMEISVTVNAKKAGTYTVVAGYTKPGTGKWLRGAITHAEYFGKTTVTLGEGDTKVVRIRCFAPPVGTREWATGIYSSSSDVVTYR